MNRWTVKEMNSLSSYDFAKAILIERRGNLNPSSPLYAKLSEAAVEIGAAGERERKCFKCESEDCAYNHGGMCRFARVHEEEPMVVDEIGCQDAVIL